MGRLNRLQLSTYKENRGVAGPGKNYGYLVDVIGGEKIGAAPREKGAKQEEAPSEILIMDENGYLRSSNSRFAKEKLDAFKTRYQPTDGSATGGGVGNGETGENRGGGGILFGPPGGA